MKKTGGYVSNARHLPFGAPQRNTDSAVRETQREADLSSYGF